MSPLAGEIGLVVIFVHVFRRAAFKGAVLKFNGDRPRLAGACLH